MEESLTEYLDQAPDFVEKEIQVQTGQIQSFTTTTPPDVFGWNEVATIQEPCFNLALALNYALLLPIMSMFLRNIFRLYRQFITNGTCWY